MPTTTAGAFYDAGPMGRITGEVQRVNWSESYGSIPVTWQMPGGPMSFNMNIDMAYWSMAMQLSYKW